MPEGLDFSGADASMPQTETGANNEVELLDNRWAKRIESITSQWDMTKIMSPANRDEQKALFLSGEIKNPSFIYNNVPDSEKREQWRRQISDLENHVNRHEDNPIVKTLYVARCRELGVQFDFMDAIGQDDQKLHEASQYLWGVPTQEDLRGAIEEREYVKNENKKIIADKDLQEARFEPEKLQQVFNRALEDYGFHWGVDVSDEVVAVTVRATGVKHPQILIPSSKRFSYEGMQGLVSHEIETHVLRGENAKSTRLGILRDTVKLDHYLGTEEGLATYQEVEGRKRITGKRPVPGLGAIGVGFAMDNDFRGTFEKLRAIGISEKSAWNQTTRVFRGRRDTSKPGLPVTIDWSYRNGNLGIKEFIHNNGDIQRLYVGKCGLHHIKALWQLGIRSPKREVKYLKIEDLLSEK